MSPAITAKRVSANDNFQGSPFRLQFLAMIDFFSFCCLFEIGVNFWLQRFGKFKFRQAKHSVGNYGRWRKARVLAIVVTESGTAAP